MVIVRKLLEGLANGLKRFVDNFSRGLEILACKMGKHTVDTFGENVGDNRYFPIITMRCEHCDKIGFHAPMVNDETWIRGDIDSLRKDFKECIDPDWMEGYRFAKENR